MDRSITQRVIAVVREGSHNITRDKNYILRFYARNDGGLCDPEEGKHPPKAAEVRVLWLPCNDAWTAYFPRLTAGWCDGLISIKERGYADRGADSGAAKEGEALYFGATTAGERDAAEAAAERLKAKLEEACRTDPAVHGRKLIAHELDDLIDLARDHLFVSRTRPRSLRLKIIN